MRTSWKTGLLTMLGLALVAGAIVLANRDQVRATEQGKGGEGGPRYTIVETQGHNLLVTDNVANKVYFYTKDENEKIGADLKLRASCDLTQVGKDVIHITSHIKK